MPATIAGPELTPLQPASLNVEPQVPLRFFFAVALVTVLCQEGTNVLFEELDPGSIFGSPKHVHGGGDVRRANHQRC